MSEPSLKLFATRLPKDWTDDQVKEYFSAQGSVTSVSVFKSQSKSSLHAGIGCAYITFQKKSEAEEVIRRLSKELTTENKIQLRWADGETERLKYLKELSGSYLRARISDTLPTWVNVAPVVEISAVKR